MTAVRKAGKEDILLIRHIAVQTWPVAYGNILSAAQLKYMLDLFYSPESLEKQMAGGDVFFILADSGFASCGVISEKAHVARLHKLYVVPEKQCGGQGKILLTAVVEWAARNDLRYVELNVNRHNNAKGFYEKQGFTVEREEDIDIGNGYFMNDYVMTRPVHMF